MESELKLTVCDRIVLLYYHTLRVSYSTLLYSVQRAGFGGA